jgi:DNA polymerase-3 subunit epsilon
MREMVLDTETTGLDPGSGHRIVEVGCVELVDHMPTNNNYQEYINPERDVPMESFNIHGLSEAFLADKPVFAEIAGSFLEYIGDAPLIIHNASFDLKFLNAELKLLGFKPIPMTRAIDTLQIARSRYPGASATLDELCRRFGVDNTARTSHGALLDSELLAAVYIDLIGAREPGLDLGGRARAASEPQIAAIDRPVRPARAHAPSAAEEAAHEAFLEKLTDPIWKRGSAAVAAAKDEPGR